MDRFIGPFANNTILSSRASSAKHGASIKDFRIVCKRSKENSKYFILRTRDNAKLRVRNAAYSSIQAVESSLNGN
jgi:hypothetical protein